MNHNQNYVGRGLDGSVDAERPEGHFTSRARMLTDQAEQFARRMDRLLGNVRGAPPPTPTENDSLGAVGSSSLADHLSHHEIAHKSIETMLSELEGLL